ncbi:MAG TPA: hypothetical protein PKN47_17150 [Nitrospira sp.]|jgi:hypothetical protein|nr:hypothetical protein [Nitrospira sp.]MBX3121024.1 hypothetical protein [Fimbriimonadaceae bacterium]MCE7975839.1 hypothetical protein [Nitrospira sp. NTP1]HNP83192.1 hypothetical protein [Nitrospira sp.]
MSIAELPNSVFEDAPLSCVFHSAQDNLYDVGKIVGLSMHHCHVESQAEVTPGMTLSLFVVLPTKRRALVLDEALVTWVRTEEFGVRLKTIPGEDAAYLESYLAGHKVDAGLC